jgi:hypothetical protein
MYDFLYNPFIDFTGTDIWKASVEDVAELLGGIETSESVVFQSHNMECKAIVEYCAKGNFAHIVGDATRTSEIIRITISKPIILKYEVSVGKTYIGSILETYPTFKGSPGYYYAELFDRKDYSTYFFEISTHNTIIDEISFYSNTGYVIIIKNWYF